MKKAKKSGFTMIEMLATILVLLVVVLIATPSIRRMVTNSDELSKGYTEELVLDAARDYATINNKEVTKDLKIVGNYTIISLETLKNIGLIEEEDITKLGVDAKVKVTLEEDLYVKFEIVYDSLLTEDIKPTIILLGEDPYYLLQGKVYVDPGYVAFDRHGNTITNLVVVTGTVNKDVIGTYTLTYSLTDNEGNVGDPVTRVVNVVDSTYPAVTVAIAESNNIYHNKFVRNSETVTLNLTFSKIVTDPTVLIGGRTATVTGSGNTRVATYEIPEFESLLVSQALSVLVKDYEDIYENEGIEATNVTSGGLVVYDNIKPLITSTTIISNNTFNKYAKNGHIITMTTNFTEPVRSLTSTIHGRTPTTTNGLNTSTVTKTYTIPVAESTLVQGDVVGLITEYMDRAGNIGISNDIRLSGGTVVYDRTAPVCGTWTPNPSPWKASGTQTFTLASSTDALSGINVAGGPCTTGSAHGNTCTVTISDRSLNTLVCTSPINRVDTTPPAVTTHTPTSRDWANANVSVAIGGGADAESGFLRREYCYTTNGTTCTPSTIGNSVTFTVTGQYTLCSRAVDNVNNLSTPTTCSVANAYKIDKTAPTTPTVSYTNGYVTSTTQSVTFSSTDGESGVSSYTLYRRSATMTGGTCGTYGTWANLGTQTSPYTSTVASGNCYQYYVTATNGVSLSASSTTSPASVTKVDTSAPGATTVTYTNGYINSGTTQTLTFSSTGDTQSGISSYTVYRRSATMTGGTCGAYGTWTSLGVRTSGYAPTVTSGNCYQYYVVTTNGAGLTSSSTTSPTAVTKVDTSAPGATTVSYANGYITSTTQSVTFSSTGDSQSGISSYTVYRRSATMTNGTCGAYGAWGSLGAQTSPYTSTVASGNCYQYYVLTTNGAGLTSRSTTSPTSVTRVDTSVPVCGTWTPSISPWKASGTQSFTLDDSTDTQSGISTSGGSCETGSTNGSTCSVLISNNAGLTTSCTSPINRVDTTPPAVTTHNPTSRAWANANVSVAIGGGADAQSGFLRREYCYTTNGTTCTPSTIGNSVTFTATGQYTLCSRAVDAVGNIGSRTCSAANAYKIDKTAPTSVVIGYTNGYITSGTTQSVTFSATDGESGGITYILYRRSATMTGGTCGTYGTWTNLGTQISPYTSTVASGNCYQYYVTATNGVSLSASSTTSPASVTKVDTSAPGATTVTYTNGYINSGTTQTLTFSSTGDTQSGISSYTVYRRSATMTGGTCGAYGTWTSLGVRTSGYAPTVTSGNCYQYYVVTTNGAGLTSSSTTSPTAVTKVDTSAPGATTVSYANGYITSTTQSVTFSSTGDSQSGISSYTVYRRSATMTNGTCGAYGAWGSLGAQTSPYTSTVASGNCYQYYVLTTNGAGLTSRSTTSPTSVTRVDTSVPVCGTWTPSISPWKASGTQSFTLDDSTDTQSGISTAGGSCETGSTNGSTCSVLISNNAGLTRSCTSPINRVDTTPPAVTTHNPTSRAWANANVSVAIGGGADAQSGFLRREYCYTTNGTTCTPSTIGNSVTFTATGQYTLCSRAVDAVGNIGSRTCSAANAYKIDKTAPTTPTVSYTNGYVTSTTQSVTFSSTDGESGVSSYTLYRRSATMTGGTCGTYGTWANLGTQTSPYTSTVASGNCYQYYVKATNGVSLSASSTTSPASVTKVDTSAPGTTTVSYTNGYITSTTQSVTFSSTGDTQSGISSYTVYRRSAAMTNGTCGAYGAWGSLGTQTSPYTSTVTSGNCYQYYVLTKNGAGLTSSSTTSPTAVTKVDTSAPSAPTITASGTEISKTVTLSGSSDTQSGILRYEYSLSGATTLGWTSGSSFTITKPGKTLVSARAVNNAGLTSTTSTQNVSNDATAPTITYTNSGSWYSTLPATTITVQDTASGMAKLRYAWTTSTANPAGITSTTCTGGTAITVSGTAAITNATATGKPTTTGSSYYLHVCAVDVANNVRKSYSRYYLDATNPTCGTWTPNPSPWKASGGQTFTLASSTDTGSGISTAGGSCVTGATNGSTCSVLISDNVGRTATCTSPINRRDPTPPAVTTHNPTSRAWANANVSVTIGGGADAQSGFGYYQYCSTTTGATCTPSTSGEIAKFTATGQYTLCSRAVDAVGNIGSRTCSVANAYKIDKTVPTLSFATNPVYVTPSSTAKLSTFATTSDSHSGVASVTVREGVTVYTTVDQLSIGTHSLEYTVTDAVGNYVVGTLQLIKYVDNTSLCNTASPYGETGKRFNEGANPNNYVTFNEEAAGWRIVSCESDGTYKITKASIPTATQKFDASTNPYDGNWVGSDLNKYLNGTYYNGLSLLAKSQIKSKAWNIGIYGAGASTNTTVTQAIDFENNSTWTGYVGLIQASDYLAAGTNAACENYNLANNGTFDCRLNNWLFNSNYRQWTINSYSTTRARYINITGALSFDLTNRDWFARPTVYLLETTKFTGSGTSADPFIIVSDQILESRNKVCTKYNTCEDSACGGMYYQYVGTCFCGDPVSTNYGCTAEIANAGGCRSFCLGNFMTYISGTCYRDTRYASCPTVNCGCQTWSGWSSWAEVACTPVTNYRLCEYRLN